MFILALSSAFFCEVFDCFSVFELTQGLATWKGGEQQNRVTQNIQKITSCISTLANHRNGGLVTSLRRWSTGKIATSSDSCSIIKTLLLIILSQLETVVDCEKPLVESLSFCIKATYRYLLSSAQYDTRSHILECSVIIELTTVLNVCKSYLDGHFVGSKYSLTYKKL